VNYVWLLGAHGRANHGRCTQRRPPKPTEPEHTAIAKRGHRQRRGGNSGSMGLVMQWSSRGQEHNVIGARQSGH
jgi:hypothetical protein